MPLLLQVATIPEARMATSPLSNAFSIHNPQSFFLASTPTKLSKHIALQHGKNLLHGPSHEKPISTATALSFSPVFDPYRKFGNSGVTDLGCKYGSRSFPNPSVSARHDNQPHRGSGLDEFTGAENAEEKKLPSNLRSLMKVYKRAIVEGDEKVIYEVEDVIFTIDKEKNELAKRITALSAELSSVKEKYVRLQADFDNYRKRSEKERLTVRSDAQGEVIESLLPMVDSFERAKQQLKLETDKEKRIDASYQGIYKQFVEIMRSLRVAVVPTVGKSFDPSVHEAIAREESQQFKEGIVIQELRRGFFLGERLLRPAMVKVSSGPGKKNPPSPEQKQASVAGFESGR